MRARIRPWRLLRSLVRIARDPNNTADGARIVLTFDRGRQERNYQRFAADPRGAAMLAGDPTLFDLLSDRDALRSLSEGSLGREFLEFSEREGISIEGLDREVEPIERELWNPDPRRRRYLMHLRASHDLWHVLTGYSRDLLGELLLLRFSWIQLHTPMFGFLTWLSSLGIERRIPGAAGLLREAEERAARSDWLPTRDWAALLRLPIAEVREQLGIGPPPSYTRYVRKPRGLGLVPEST
jgi:ubiquinone biosynthesis protein COQ4